MGWGFTVDPDALFAAAGGFETTAWSLDRATAAVPEFGAMWTGDDACNAQLSVLATRIHHNLSFLTGQMHELAVTTAKCARSYAETEGEAASALSSGGGGGAY